MPYYSAGSLRRTRISRMFKPELRSLGVTVIKTGHPYMIIPDLTMWPVCLRIWRVLASRADMNWKWLINVFLIGQTIVCDTLDTSPFADTRRPELSIYSPFHNFL